MKYLKLYEKVKILKQADINDCFIDLIHDRFWARLNFISGFIEISKRGLDFNYSEIEDNVLFAIDYLEDEFNITFTGYYGIYDGGSVKSDRIDDWEDIGNNLNRLDPFFSLRLYFKIK